jgi:tRNA pseudouridine55 synthase
MDGLLVIDKPAGPTSHDIVARLRRVLGESRIGHTGTLDPAASGVLPLVLGRATRLARFMSGADKTYDAIICLGQATDTYDADGVPVGERSAAIPARAQVDAALDAFRGTYEQQPPAFSAKKIAGRRSYESARAARQAGDTVAAPPPLPKPVRVTAHRIDILETAGDRVTLRVECSSGFYVRSLAHDLGVSLRTGAHLAALRRIASAGLTLADACPLDAAEKSRDTAVAAVIPLERMLPHVPAVVLSDGGVERAVHGRDLGRADAASDGIWPVASTVRLVDRRGQLVGIAEPAALPGLLHPSVVLR